MNNNSWNSYCLWVCVEMYCGVLWCTSCRPHRVGSAGWEAFLKPIIAWWWQYSKEDSVSIYWQWGQSVYCCCCLLLYVVSGHTWCL